MSWIGSDWPGLGVWSSEQSKIKFKSKILGYGGHTSEISVNVSELLVIRDLLRQIWCQLDVN